MTEAQLIAQADFNEVFAVLTTNTRKKRKLLKVAKDMRREAIRMNPVSNEIEKMNDSELLEALLS